MKTEYKLNLNFKDCLAIIFRRNKRCLNCNSIVVRKVEKKYIEKGLGIEKRGHSIDVGHGASHLISVKYICYTCSKSFLPRDFW